MDEDTLVGLGEIGARTSLRHVVQLLTPAAILAKTKGRDTICKEVGCVCVLCLFVGGNVPPLSLLCLTLRQPQDLDEIDGLFYDAKASAKLLQDNAEKYIS